MNRIVSIVCCAAVLLAASLPRARAQQSDPGKQWRQAEAAKEQARQQQMWEHDLQHWRQLLDEYHQGKRGDRDGVAILFHVLTDFGLLHSTGTAEGELLTEEYRALLRKHPEYLREHLPIHTHEQIAEEAARKHAAVVAAEQIAQEARSLVPKDTRPLALRGHDDKMALIYQYHAEFFRLTPEMKLARGVGSYSPLQLYVNGRLLRGKSAIEAAGLRPIVSLTFRHRIQPPADTRKFIWICDGLLAGYVGSDDEEIRIIRRKFPSGEMPWDNKNAKFHDFCGAVGFDGEVIYKLPVKQHVPDTVVLVGHANRDGSSIEMQIGTVVHEMVDAEHSVDAAPGEVAFTFGDPRHRLIYTYPDKIESFKESDSEAIAKALKAHGF